MVTFWDVLLFVNCKVPFLFENLKLGKSKCHLLQWRLISQSSLENLGLVLYSSSAIAVGCDELCKSLHYSLSGCFSSNSGPRSRGALLILAEPRTACTPAGAVCQSQQQQRLHEVEYFVRICVPYLWREPLEEG